MAPLTDDERARVVEGGNVRSYGLAFDGGIGVLTLGLIVIMGTGLLDYLSGWSNGAVWYVAYPIVIYLPLLSSAGLGIFLLVRVVRSIGKLTLTQLVRQITILVILAFACSLALYHKPSSIAAFLEGFRDRICSKADIPAIRSWKPKVQNDQSEMVPEAAWPEAVRELAPERVFVHQYDQRVKLGCGGGGLMGHWGLIVGPETMLTPASSGMDTYLPLCPGAYVYFYGP
jgi:hypothetical protein